MELLNLNFLTYIYLKPYFICRKNKINPKLFPYHFYFFKDNVERSSLKYRGTTALTLSGQNFIVTPLSLKKF